MYEYDTLFGEYIPRGKIRHPWRIIKHSGKSGLVFHLYLLREACTFPFITGSSPVLQSLLAVVVLVQKCSTKEFIGRSNSLRTEKS